MSNRIPGEKEKSFQEHRTSWKWFERIIKTKYDIAEKMNTKEITLMRIQLEILKELQYMNDMK